MYNKFIGSMVLVVLLASVPLPVRSASDVAGGLPAERNARIAADAQLQNQIISIESRLNVTNLRGKKCPTGLAVLGIGNNAELICGAPWRIIAPGDPPPRHNIFCTEHYDRVQAEAAILAYLETTQSVLSTHIFPPITHNTSLGPITVTFNPMSLSGSFAVSAPLVELTEAQPCADAVNLHLTLPSATLTGTISIPGLGTSNYQIDVQTPVIRALITLSAPDLSSISGTTTFARQFTSISIVGFDAASIDVQFTGGPASFLAQISNLMQTTFIDQLLESFARNMEPDLKALPSPVTVHISPAP